MVRRGGDIAVMAGSMVGAWAGASSIPGPLLARIERRPGIGGWPRGWRVPLTLQNLSPQERGFRGADGIAAATTSRCSHSCPDTEKAPVSRLTEALRVG